MKSFEKWKEQNEIDPASIVGIDQDTFNCIVLEYFDQNVRGNMPTFFEHSHGSITEAVEASRYSIECNYRTKAKEVLEGYAKIALGYVSAALKNHGYHTKHVYSEKPLRLLVSSRNWDDGEWVGCVTWNHEHDCFVVSKGFYNKEKRTVNIQRSERSKGENAAEVARELINMMHGLKNLPDRRVDKLKPVPLKRGPKG